MADISLSKAVRSNLLSLQSTAASMAKTQERLATGLKVNSALDNPTNFFTASALNSRAGDMANLLDSMSSGIKTIEAADNGLKSITKTVETMQSTLRQARQDKSFKTESYVVNPGRHPVGTEDISFEDGAVGTTPISVNLTENSATKATTATAAGQSSTTLLSTLGYTNGDVFTITDGTTTVTVTVTTAASMDLDDLATAINGSGPLKITASFTTDGKFTLTADDNLTAITVAGDNPTGITTQAIPTVVNTAKTVDALVQEINNTDTLEGKIRASNDNGKLRIENLSTVGLTVTGVTTGGDINGGAGTGTVGSNDVRKNLVKQFNELRDQLDKFADDASFNGINLLRGDKLKLTFNETGTSTIEIQAKDEGGVPTSINNTALGIDEVFNADFDSDVTLDEKLDVLADVMGKLRSHASSFGSNLSIVENRTDFTKNMINTLETGAANLTLADTNEEAANLLALQTRQQLSSTALSMASQADQAVLRLFG